MSEKKCPFCDGDCERCAYMPISEEWREEETKESMERALRKEFGKELYEWTMADARIITDYGLREVRGNAASGEEERERDIAESSGDQEGVCEDGRRG